MYSGEVELMKMICSKCGKRFDGEEHLYICPKCNHYHSQTGVHGRKRETTPASSLKDKKSKISDPFKDKKKTSDIFERKKDSKALFTDAKKNNPLEGSVKSKIKDKLENVNVMELIDDLIPDDTPDSVSNEESEFIETLNGEQKVYTAVPSKKPESTFEPESVLKKIGLAICIIIGFITAIGSTIGDFDDWSDDGDSWNSGWSTYTNEVEYGESMYFDGFSVDVCNVGSPYVDGLECPDGYKLVQIDYTAECDVEEDSVMGSVSLICDSTWGDALYEENLSDDEKIQQALIDSGFSYEVIMSGEHYWIFKVPEDTYEATLEVTSFIAYDEVGVDSAHYQDETMEMQIELD